MGTNPAITVSFFCIFWKQCCDLLNQLGIPWVKADGEAEALCAHLNATSFVDACLTNDSDSFLYGANVVYRNFSSDDQVQFMKATSFFVTITWIYFVQDNSYDHQQLNLLFFPKYIFQQLRNVLMSVYSCRNQKLNYNVSVLGKCGWPTVDLAQFIEH